MPLLWRCMYEGFANEMRTLCVLTIRVNSFVSSFSLIHLHAMHFNMMNANETQQERSMKESVELNVTKFTSICMSALCTETYELILMLAIVKLYANVFACWCPALLMPRLGIAWANKQAKWVCTVWLIVRSTSWRVSSWAYVIFNGKQILDHPQQSHFDNK